jgi:hypothetical protein
LQIEALNGIWISSIQRGKIKLYLHLPATGNPEVSLQSNYVDIESILARSQQVRRALPAKDEDVMVATGNMNSTFIVQRMSVEPLNKRLLFPITALDCRTSSSCSIT